MLQPAPDAVDQRAVADRHEDRVERLGPGRQLDRHSPGTLGDRRFAPIDHQAIALLCGEIAGVFPGGVEVRAAQVDRRAEAAHPRHFQRVGRLGGEDVERDTALARGVGEPLPEIPGRGADERRAVIAELLHEEIGAAPLEGANRIGDLDLADEAHTEPRRQPLQQELRRIAEDRIDRRRRSGDALQ